MLDSPAMKLLLTSVAASLMLSTAPGRAGSAQTDSPTLAGRWQVIFTLASPHRLQFDAQASGEGAFLSLDPVSVMGPPPTVTKATWSLRGRSPAIYYFVIAGDVEFQTTDGAIEKGRLELSASSDFTLPINSLRGWAQFHSSSTPNDGRGSNDPIFDFTAERIEKLSVQVMSPASGQRLRRGKDVRIEWTVNSALPVSTQEVLISVDGGDSFIVIASGLGAEVRDFSWTLPENINKTKKALIKVVATDNGGNNTEGTTGTFRIK